MVLTTVSRLLGGRGAPPGPWPVPGPLVLSAGEGPPLVGPLGPTTLHLGEGPEK